jgi:hypothetical protein
LIASAFDAADPVNAVVGSVALRARSLRLHYRRAHDDAPVR